MILKMEKEGIFEINVIKYKCLVYVMLFFIFFSCSNESIAQHMVDLPIIEVNKEGREAYELLGKSKMFRTEAKSKVEDIISKIHLFNDFKSPDLDMDSRGIYDYWFVFKVNTKIEPLYLTLPVLQNFEIDLYLIEQSNATLISKGGVFTPKREKFLNYPLEIFDLKIGINEDQTYLLKVNRINYKAFPARIMSSKTLLLRSHRSFILEGILLGIILCVVLYHLLFYIRITEKIYLLLGVYMTFLLLQVSAFSGLLHSVIYFENLKWNHIIFNLIPPFTAIFSNWFSYVFLNISKKSHPIISRIFLILTIMFASSAVFALLMIPILEQLAIITSAFSAPFLLVVGLIRVRENFKPAIVYLIAYLPAFLSIPYLLLYASGNINYSWFTHNNLLISIAIQAILFSLAIAAKIRILKSENEKLLREENLRLEVMVNERTIELQMQTNKVEQALQDLKATQSQLIHSEKMASLGELTAGIAHEIQNPLNFVNNFSEVSRELLQEMVEELKMGNNEEAFEIAEDIVQNLDKITHHGKRADGIVKGMLQHSRRSNAVKELVDINALCDEYFRLSYHGLRAKDKTFNATMVTDLDPNIEKISIIPQDMGRVILNLLTNAFYATTERSKLEGEKAEAEPKYVPTVTLRTKKLKDKIEIRVEDNGIGIPKLLVEKIFQPFFTTKPTGQGTGLGLSLSYDIVKEHGGEFKVESKESEGTTFIIVLPKTAES